MNKIQKLPLELQQKIGNPTPDTPRLYIEFRYNNKHSDIYCIFRLTNTLDVQEKNEYSLLYFTNPLDLVRSLLFNVPTGAYAVSVGGYNSSAYVSSDKAFDIKHAMETARLYTAVVWGLIE